MNPKEKAVIRDIYDELAAVTTKAAKVKHVVAVDKLAKDSFEAMLVHIEKAKELLLDLQES